MTATDPDPDPDAVTHRDDCRGGGTHVVRGRDGDLLRRCRGCPRFVVLTEDDPPEQPESPGPPNPRPRGRHVLTCCRCGRELRFHRPGPRVPVCDRCNTET